MLNCRFQLNQDPGRNLTYVLYSTDTVINFGRRDCSDKKADGIQRLFKEAQFNSH